MTAGVPWQLADAGFDLRVGTDLQPIAEVEEAIRTRGERYLARLFTAYEVQTCGGPGAAPETLAAGLAARFAAKEATLKVLRPTPNMVPRWTEIEVVSGEGGWTELALIGQSADMARAAELAFLRLSMSHGGGFALATVVAVRLTQGISGR